MDDKAVLASDALEARLTKRIETVYGAALKKAIAENKRFFQKLRDIDSGKIQPPASYDTPEKVKKWREGYIRELMRQENVIASIRQQIELAGAAIAPEIKQEMANIYAVNRNYTATQISSAAGVSAASVNLMTGVTRRQAEIILRDTQPLFSKIAYQNLQTAPAIMRRLQNEMTQATLLGESQQKIVKRIRSVMGNSASNARRIAQTERTRLQSQSRAEQLKEAEDMGITTTKTWTARMVNTRESHAALDGKTVYESEKFKTIWGNELSYPGDPSAPAREVINCHCVLIPGVELAGDKKPVERLKKAPENGIIEGKKTAENAAENAAETAKAITEQFRYTDEWGETYSPINTASFAAMPADAQQQAAAGIQKAQELFNLNTLPKQISFGSLRGAYGVYNETTRMLTLSSKYCKNPAEAYSTMVHELTHYYDQISGHVAESVYKQALKELGIRANSKTATNLSAEIVGVFNTKEHGNVSEIFAYGIEKAVHGSQNKLAIKMLEIIEKGMK